LAMKTAHQLRTSLHSMNNLWQCQLFVDAVSTDSWQCQMEIYKEKSMKTAQSAIGSMCKSFQSCGPGHNKKSEQVGNSASPQPQGYAFILIPTCHQCHHNLDSNHHATKIGVVTKSCSIIFWKQLNVQTAQCAKCFQTMS
jgi:hypothetical protein